VIFEGPYQWRLRPVGEIFIEREFGAARQVSGLIGFIWRVADSFALDAGVRAARKDRFDLVELRAGLTWSFGYRSP
jgi:hypothetical protein